MILSQEKILKELADLEEKRKVLNEALNTARMQAGCDHSWGQPTRCKSTEQHESDYYIKDCPICGLRMFSTTTHSAVLIVWEDGSKEAEVLEIPEPKKMVIDRELRPLMPADIKKAFVR